jgi:chromosome segregation ATPase
MRNHEAAFAELKAYYNEITIENLTLIKAQKQRIEELQASLMVNGKLITEIKAKNKAMEEPLERSRKLRDDMKYALRLHQKDIMALANLKTKLKSLRERITKLEREQDIIDARYAKVIKEKKELESRFERVTVEVKSHADAKNVALSRKLGGLSEMLEIKDTQLNQIIRQSNIDPHVINAVNAKLQESIESKNALIKNLQYSIQHASKAYNDAIRVYEAKLTEFGVPADELGFQVLETKASLMPAGLVSSQ